jgi:RimJ/RimL family protein N-acetyltransferase
LAYEFAIIDPGDESVIGGCGLNHVNIGKGYGNLGYWVRSSRRGQAIAARATRLVARFAFEQVGVVRVEIVVAVHNRASSRTAEKAGARREGVLRNRMVVRDQVYEAVMYSLVPEDFGLPRPAVYND